jgi:hypothetical protein
MTAINSFGEEVVPNPNGAGRYTSDPREQICWDFYIEALTGGIDNAHAAALKAGYTESTAITVTSRTWWQERKARLRRKDMLSKAERNLDKVLDLEVEETSEAGTKINPALLKIKTDVSVTIAKTLGNKHYSEKTETKHTGEVAIVGINYIVPKENGDNIKTNDEATSGVSEP